MLALEDDAEIVAMEPIRSAASSGLRELEIPTGNLVRLEAVAKRRRQRATAVTAFRN